MAHKVESFARYGVMLKNVRSDWSGVSPDGQIVAIVLWTHLFKPKDEYAYDVFGVDGVTPWERRPGNITRLEHLRYALAHREGLFRVVCAKAKDASASVHDDADYFARPELIMRIGSAADISDRGEFRAKLMRY